MAASQCCAFIRRHVHLAVVVALIGICGPDLDTNGKLSLARPLEEGSMTVGINSARSYGAAIDGLLHPYNGKPNLAINAAPNPAKSLLQMTVLRRIDAVRGFPY